MTTSLQSPARFDRTIVADGGGADDAGFTRCGSVLWRIRGDEVQLRHRFTVDSIDDDSAVRALGVLVEAGVLRGQSEFESAMTAVISSGAADPVDAWTAFYVNSLAALESGRAAFSPVHRRALSSIVGDEVLEVGSCFGLFALQAARAGHRVTACDVCPEALELLAFAAARTGVRVEVGLGDARRLPHHDDAVDTVTLIHLLEHLDEAEVECALREAVRVARRRVVAAVPFEEVPTEHFGHRQRLSLETLHRWARPWADTGVGTTVLADHGGWLILDVSAGEQPGPLIR